MTGSPALVAMTGAAGKTGLAVTRAATAAGLPVRALVRRDEQREVLLEAGAAEAVVVDLRDETSLAVAYTGADAVYHLAPNVDPDEVGLGVAALAVARRCGARRFVLHSVLHPYAPPMPHHVRKAEVEHLVRTSGLAWTVLQPAAYAQNLVAMAEVAARTGRLEVPYSVDAPFTLVDLDDVAAAAAAVLADPRHTNATYELAGPTVTTVADVGRLIARRRKTHIEAVRIDVDEWQAGAGASLLADAVRSLRAMFGYYDLHGFVGNSTALSHLLGRSPSTVEDVIAREVAQV